MCLKLQSWVVLHLGVSAGLAGVKKVTCCALVSTIKKKNSGLALFSLSLPGTSFRVLLAQPEDTRHFWRTFSQRTHAVLMDIGHSPWTPLNGGGHTKIGEGHIKNGGGHLQVLAKTSGLGVWNIGGQFLEFSTPHYVNVCIVRTHCGGTFRFVINVSHCTNYL